jgi:hypothetical protein
MLRYRKEAAPWLRVIGILSYIGCGFMALGGIAAIIVTFTVADLSGEFAELAGGGMGFLYVVSGALMFFPARFTYGFGGKIRAYLRSNDQGDLEQALKNNKSLWKFNGILYIIGLALVPVVIIIVIITTVGALLF